MFSNNRVLWESESGDIDPWVALSQITIVQSVRTQWKGSTEQHTTVTHKNPCQPRCQIWCPTLNCLSTSRWCVMCDRTIVTCHELSRAVMIVTLLPTSVNNFPGHRSWGQQHCSLLILCFIFLPSSLLFSGSNNNARGGIIPFWRNYVPDSVCHWSIQYWTLR